METALPMLYAILCYHDEDAVTGSWTREQDAAVMEEACRGAGQIDKAGPARPGGAAVADHIRDNRCARKIRQWCSTVRIARDQGAIAPASTSIDCKNLDEALDVARDLGEANPGGAYEIRPVGVLNAREHQAT